MTFAIDSSTSSGKRQVDGVRFADGEEMKADLVVVATGAWTPALFAQPMMGGLPSVVAAGQCVAKIQLTPDEVKEYAGIPVVSSREFDVGFETRHAGADPCPIPFHARPRPPVPRPDHGILLLPSQPGRDHETRHPRRRIRQHL
jgi:glycine/D-amino acid oxidase-like deaminating enzyme